MNKRKANNEINKMRPISEYDKSLLFREKAGRDFYDKYQSLFIDVSCPACGYERGMIIYEKFGFSHKKCSACRTVWCSPRPTDLLLSEYYNNSETTQYWTQFLIKIENNRKIIQYTPRVNHIINILNETMNQYKGETIAVDVGAGSGAFALSLKQTNYFSDVIAIDVNKDCCKICASLGLNTKHGSIDIIKDHSINLISMNDLIEHLFDPLAFLTQCKTKMINGGAISIACPNGEGFDYQIMQEKTLNIIPPEHLNYFNPGSISLLLNRAGFKIISITTPEILDVQIIKRALQQKKITMDNNTYLKYLLLNAKDKTLASLQTFIQSNNLSSHMVALAPKV